ncbi:hypothetical protein JANAI62_18810 [Jannaschia pagri]|uniref:ABC transporter domain-containing protein n=1 Tax=Jannaschia pagri TaxID=2829797 RepID=A0ABQ4NLG1_9RHOB|nr:MULTISPECIES: ATP-binding cassette domain-containing protein [unclassified Jannaschia]GIT91424.1 hypothetical protein JANAI61_18820 [Jannaschia sp. AI_61]GIT95258.1 hypothetical protein JANAI62_18810 [Jannaschia sp. AI_62]
MIVLRNLTKTFTVNGRSNTVADNLNAVFPTGVSVGLLGRNGAGKSTLLRLIAGTSTPSWGEVLSTGSVSFPVGLADSMHADLTGAQNTRFVARIYGADTESLMDWVEDFAELGEHFHLPVRSYSSGMKGRLSFGINMGLAFDTYLVDEVTAVGDAAFRRKSSEVFRGRMETSGAIFVSHSMGQIRDLCTAGAMLENGKLQYYEEVDEAIDRYLFSLDPDRTREAAVPARDDSMVRLPEGVRMLYGLGLPVTHAGWVGDCLRRHRQCLCPDVTEPHYFDTRAGRNRRLLRDRNAALRKLSAQQEKAKGADRSKLLGKISDTAALLQIHAAPSEGETRHEAYLDFMQRHRRSQPLLCDLTPAYARLRQLDFSDMAGLGDGVFLLVLRDPVDRYWEALCLDMPEEKRTADTCARQLRQLLAEGPEEIVGLRPDSDYARLMSRLLPEVPKDRIVTLFHEHLDDPEARLVELERMTTTLGLDVLPDDRRPTFPDRPDVPKLPGELGEKLMEMLLPQYEAIYAEYGSDVPLAWRWRPEHLNESLPAA